jgi:RHS repeat-associated protein
VVYTYAGGDKGGRLMAISYPYESYAATGDVTYTYGTSGSLNDVIGRLDALKLNGSTVENYSYLGYSTVVYMGHPQTGVDLTYLGSPVSTGTGANDQYAGLDRFGRISRQLWTSGTNSKDDYAYTYDRNGNVTGKANGLNSAYSETYTYDGLNQLLTVTRNGTSYQGFALDGMGNITTVTGQGSGSIAYNSQNQITSWGVTYDNNGNMTLDHAGHTYIYDAWNRLVMINDDQGHLIKAYEYDGLGRIIRDMSPETTKDYYYSASGQILFENRGFVSHVDAIYVYSPIYINAVLLKQYDTDDNNAVDTRVYFTHDANFNVTAVISTSGVVQQRMVYEAYGNVEFQASNWSSASDSYDLHHLWQGGWRDTATTLYHFGARWYSPAMRRWISAEPYGAGYIDGLNLYGAMGGNPINRVDPMGLWDEVFWGDMYDLFIAGPAQGYLNVQNGITDAGVGLINLVPGAGNLVFGSGSFNYINAPDWSRGLMLHEPTKSHNASKFLGGQGVILLATAGAGSVGNITIPAARMAQLSNGRVVLIPVVVDTGVAIQNAALAAQAAAIMMQMAGPGGSGGNGQEDCSPGQSNNNRPPNLTPPDAGRSGALREALRRNGVPTGQQPSRVLPNVDRRGNIQPGRVYEYDIPAPGGGTRTVRIRDDAGGHYYGPNDPQNRGPHFNDEFNGHYDY